MAGIWKDDISGFQSSTEKYSLTKFGHKSCSSIRAYGLYLIQNIIIFAAIALIQFSNDASEK